MKLKTDYFIGSGVSFGFSIHVSNDASTIGRKSGDSEFYVSVSFINVFLSLALNW